MITASSSTRRDTWIGLSGLGISSHEGPQLLQPIRGTMRSATDASSPWSWTRRALILAVAAPALDWPFERLQVPGSQCWSSAREGEERGEEVAVGLVSQCQATIAAEPGDGPFNDPAVSSAAMLSCWFLSCLISFVGGPVGIPDALDARCKGERA
jgi:hypothetical protein